MGVDNATASGNGENAASPHRRGEPQDYFYHLSLDTLQVTVKGQWLQREGIQALLDQRRRAESFAEAGFGEIRHTTHDGRKLIVHPHAGRRSYQVLMRDGDGLEVRALPTGNMPEFIFRFGARWCVENSTQDLERWTTAFVGELGFTPEIISLSEVHIRCDSPIPFVDEDRQHMRGVGMRKGGINSRYHQGQFSGIDNLGGKKSVKFVLYDKRLEQTHKPGPLWAAVWDSYGIPRDTPIWRTEARWDRKALRAMGLEYLSQLDERTIPGLWYRFTSEYIIFVADTDRRTSRTVPLEKWAKIQACGKMMVAQPVVALVDITPMQLIKQATGCLARAMAIAGVGHAEREIESVIYDTVREAERRFLKDREAYVWDLLQSVVERYAKDALGGAANVTHQIKQLIERALASKALAQPFSPAE